MFNHSKGHRMLWLACALEFWVSWECGHWKARWCEGVTTSTSVLVALGTVDSNLHPCTPHARGWGKGTGRESVKLPSAMCGVHHRCVNALDQKLWHQRAWSYRWLKLHPVVPTFKIPNNLNHHHRNAIVSLLRHCVERALPWWCPNLFFEVISEGLGLAHRELGTHKLWCKFTWFKNYI